MVFLLPAMVFAFGAGAGVCGNLTVFMIAIASALLLLGITALVLEGRNVDG